jgi:YD repeat-containing protein
MEPRDWSHRRSVRICWAACSSLLCLLAVVGCQPAWDIPGPVDPDPEGDGSIGGSSSTVDRSQILVPAISNQDGGVVFPFVNLWSGNLVIDYPVIQVPAIGPDWDFSLYYNSTLFGETTTLGPGWRHSYEIILQVGVPNPNSITVRWGDGRRDIFVADGGGWSAGPALHAMRITQVGGGYELRTKHGFVYAFDGLGRLVALRDRNANAMVLAYGGNGLVSVITDATGRTLQFVYDGQGQLIQVSGLGVALVASFDYQGPLLAHARDALANATSFGYDGAQLMVSATDPEGAGLTITYRPGLPVVTQVVTTDGGERRFAYDSATLETTVTDVVALGVESAETYTFDASARCTQVVSLTLGTTHNTWDAANNLIAHTDADGRTSTATFSLEGDMTSSTDPTGVTVTIGYEPAHHLEVSLVDQAGNLWTGQRDARGNLTQAVDPLGNQRAWSYSPQGLVLTATDPRLNVTTFAYNPDGYLSARTDAAGFTRSVAWNTLGVPISLTDEENNTTLVVWNDLREPLSATLPTGDVYSATWRGDHKVAAVVGPRGETFTFAYNARKQVVNRTDPMGFPFSLVYDGAGFVTRRVDALGSTLQYTLDLAGRPVSILNPDGGVVSFTHGFCDISSRTDTRGTLNYQYSPRHELIAAIAADGSVQILYTFDPRGYVATAHRMDLPNPDIGYNRIRDAAGRLIQETATHLGPRTTTFVLDAAGNVTDILSVPSSGPVHYNYNQLNQAVMVSAGTPVVTANIAYNPRGLQSLLSYSNGVVENRQYDARGRVLGIHDLGPGFVVDYNASYDQTGNPTNLNALLPAPIGPVNLHIDWDLRNMPVTVNAVPGGLTTINYDPVKDRQLLLGPGGPVNYAYTQAHRMVSAGPTILAWDPPGGCIQVNGPGNATALAYRTDGALKTVTKNAQTWQVQVDAFGRAAREVLPGGAVRLIAIDNTERGLARLEYLASPGAIPIDSYVMNGKPLLRFKSPQSPVNQRAMITDPIGSITLEVNGTGVVTQARAFGAFGEILAQSSPQPIASGFRGMEVLEGLSDMNLVGFATGGAGSLHDPFDLAIPAMRPYLKETGSFLYDAGFGADGLYAQEAGEARTTSRNLFHPTILGSPMMSRRAVRRPIAGSWSTEGSSSSDTNTAGR